MFFLNQLPKFYNPLFKNERFKKSTDDRFFPLHRGNRPEVWNGRDPHLPDRKMSRCGRWTCGGL